MKLPQNTLLLFAFCFIFSFSPCTVHSQTKEIKRPKSTVGIYSVDNFVRASFDLYDKVYKYDGYSKAGTPLDEEDIDVLEDALSEVSILSETAPDILGDLDGVSVLKQGKATLQINKAKKALNYSIKTAKELLLGEQTNDEITKPSNDDDIDDSELDNDSNEASSTEIDEPQTGRPEDLKVYSKFDFVPGDKLIYFDDFSQDFIGDFPSKWNTNGSGEVVTLNTEDGKWFELKPGYKIYYIPLLNMELPEEYTIEFDVLTDGLDKKTSSTATLSILLDDNDTFKIGRNYAFAHIPFCQYTPVGIRIKNNINGNSTINSKVAADLRDEVLNKPHISIAVNKKRFRLWVNEVKYIDVPQFVQGNQILKSLKFNINQLADGKERIFIKNLKIAEGGVDLRRTLMREGKVSTNGILFDSGSANIQPQSYGIIRQISQVLLQDNNIKLKIIGHTDADGSDVANMKLSKARAKAVKQALVDVYHISGDRLSTDGKGESAPVGDNNTSQGKSQNRRVEFIKQ